MSARPDWELLATTAGAEWAAEAARSLVAAKRTVTGGWPGTVSEARARLDAVWSMLAQQPDKTTREQLTRRAYDAARSAWRRHTVADTED